jgi:putative ABC transport system substrate-binding protein
MENVLGVVDERNIRSEGTAAFPEDVIERVERLESDVDSRSGPSYIFVSSVSRRSSLSLPVFFIWVAMAAGLLLSGCGEQKAPVHRVGILCGLDVFASTVDAFKTGMTELGYVEGKNIAYDVQRTNFDLVAEERILRKFLADKDDLILTMPSEVSVAAKAVTQGTNVPVVFCQTNIEGTNLIKCVTEPGGNITGVRYPGPDLALKRFEILRDLAPEAKRIWVPYSRSSPIVPDQLAVLRPAAAEARVTLVEAPASGAADLLAELERRGEAADIGIDAVLFISEPLARTPAVFPEIGRFASEHKIPIGGVLYSLEGYSTIFGVATDNIAVGKLAARQANKVLRGIPPGTIPVVSAESYFQLNYKAALELGLTVPDGLLRQADEIIR